MLEERKNILTPTARRQEQKGFSKNAALQWRRAGEAGAWHLAAEAPLRLTYPLRQTMVFFCCGTAISTFDRAHRSELSYFVRDSRRGAGVHHIGDILVCFGDFLVDSPAALPSHDDAYLLQLP